jgi:hypothetical protein
MGSRFEVSMQATFVVGRMFLWDQVESDGGRISDLT